MPRVLGHKFVGYLREFNFSTYFSEANWSENADVHDVTTWGSSAHVFDPGLKGYELSLTAFYDNANDAPYNRIQSGDSPIISIYDGGSIVGDAGVLFPETPISARSVSFPVADMGKLTISGAANGRFAGNARLLHPLSTDTATNNSTTPFDWGSSSTNGGLANIHITAITGTWTLEVQHSADNMTYATYLAPSSGSTAVGGYSTYSTAPVQRYTRTYYTAVATGSVTWVGGFGRF